jgi:hypothetical protein
MADREVPADEIEAFLTDLEVLYAKHNVYVGSRENIEIIRLGEPEIVRVRSKFKDPEAGEYEEYGQDVYATVAAYLLEVDRIRHDMHLWGDSARHSHYVRY